MSKYKDWEIVDGHKYEAELERRGLSPMDVFGDDTDRIESPGADKEYSFKLSGHDLNFLAELNRNKPNIKLKQLLDKIAKQVSYQF